MYDELIYHIDHYVNTTIEPTLIGLRFHLAKYTDGYYKDNELNQKLKLYLQWLEKEERYEECTYVLEMIQEDEYTDL